MAGPCLPSWHSRGRHRHCTWRVLPKAQQAQQAFKAATGQESRGVRGSFKQSTAVERLVFVGFGP